MVRFRQDATQATGCSVMDPVGRLWVAARNDSATRKCEMIGTILLVLLILILLGALPTWPHSRNWGYGPSGGLTLLVIILVILLLMGRI